MITIVGKKYLFFLLLVAPLAFSATINLKLTTLDGAALEQAGTGQPFLLNVVVTNTSNSAQYPILKGIDNLHVRQSGFQMNMVNGTTSITYHYRVRIDTPGDYNLGPAQITQDGKIVESTAIKISVGTDQKSSGKRNQKTQAQAPTLKLNCDRTNVYLGQKINAELSFYTADPTTVLQTIIEPEQINATGLVLKNKQQQPITGVEKINGVEHRFAKWTFEIVPTKPGAFVLPAYAAQYTSQGNQPMLSFFFHQDSQRVYSNTITLDIQPLPHSLKQPSFIGTITHLQATINPSHARVGQGLVYAITLSGSGDFETMGMLPIIMPEECKWYESKKYYNPTEPQAGTYTMEYIVQAIQPGTITIPKQEVYYFDTSAKRYKTIFTAPLSLTITGSAVPESEITLESTIDTSNTINPLAPIQHNGQIEDNSFKPLDEQIFWPLVLLLGAWWLIFVILYLMKDKLRNILLFFFKKRISIYTATRSTIKKAYQQKKYTNYHAALMRLFASRLDCSANQLTPELIENSLRQDGLSAQAVDDWRNFYTELTQVSFYKAELDADYYKELTQKVYYWIDVLEQLPRVHL